MKHRTLFHLLTGMNPWTMTVPSTPLTPDTSNYFYLKQGHMMEYFRFGPTGKKVIALFFEPEELVLPSHGAFSCFEPLDKVVKGPLYYRDVFRTLRNFPDARKEYRELGSSYWEKVAERLHTLITLSAVERFVHLRVTQPWVFELVKEEDIANYLDISVEMLTEFRRGKTSLPG